MFLKMTQGLKAVSGVQAEPAKNDFFVESRKSERSVQNGTDLRPDSGSAASSGSTCDWSFSKSDLYRGAMSTPAGAAYLASGGHGALLLADLEMDQSQSAASRPQLSGTEGRHADTGSTPCFLGFWKDVASAF